MDDDDEWLWCVKKNENNNSDQPGKKDHFFVACLPCRGCGPVWCVFPAELFGGIEWNSYLV
jgi:hypothetical protein